MSRNIMKANKDYAYYRTYSYDKFITYLTAFPQETTDNAWLIRKRKLHKLSGKYTTGIRIENDLQLGQVLSFVTNRGRMALSSAKCSLYDKNLRIKFWLKFYKGTVKNPDL